MIFTRVFYYSLLAGIVAGIILTAVQRLQVVPIIFGAEAFESASIDVASAGDDGHDHAHWGPEDGFERTAFTALSNALTAIGFALVMLSAMLVTQIWSGERLLRFTWKRAVGWSLAGYAVFWLAPALGLPPEIPLQNAAELQDRQVWWVICVVCAIVGVGGLAFAPAPWRWIAPLIIVVTYLIGAPHPEGPMFLDQSPEAAKALEALAGQFVYATAIANAVFWVTLGSLVTWFCVRINLSVEDAERYASA